MADAMPSSTGSDTAATVAPIVPRSTVKTYQLRKSASTCESCNPFTFPFTATLVLLGPLHPPAPLIIPNVALAHSIDGNPAPAKTTPKRRPSNAASIKARATIAAAAAALEPVPHIPPIASAAAGAATTPLVDSPNPTTPSLVAMAVSATSSPVATTPTDALARSFSATL
ncbi:hypothetical protein HK405_016072, partial [Cladochytrium tenue]